MDLHCKTRGVAPIIAVIFLIIAATVTGIFFYYTVTQPRASVSFKVEVYIDVGDNGRCLLHTLVSNTGSADIYNIEIQVEKEAATTVTLYGATGFLAGASVVDAGSYVKIDIGASVEAGKTVSGSLLTSCAWSRGEKYVVIVEADSPLGKTAYASFARTP